MRDLGKARAAPAGILDSAVQVEALVEALGSGLMAGVTPFILLVFIRSLAIPMVHMAPARTRICIAGLQLAPWGAALVPRCTPCRRLAHRRLR